MYIYIHIHTYIHIYIYIYTYIIHTHNIFVPPSLVPAPSEKASDDANGPSAAGPSAAGTGPDGPDGPTADTSAGRARCGEMVSDDGSMELLEFQDPKMELLLLYLLAIFWGISPYIALKFRP